MRVEPLDWAGQWPYPWSRLEELALDAGLEVHELRAYLEAEVARRRAALEHLPPVVDAPTAERATASDDWVYAVALQPDGKIVAAGYYNASGSGDFALARYNSDGSLDQGFGSGGKVLTDLGAASTDTAFAVALQPDGKTVAAGYSTAGPGRDFAVVRYNTNGSLDASFGSGGKVLTDFNDSGFDGAFAVALQPDGKIVTAGSSCCPGGYSQFALARYNPDGSLDTGFGFGNGASAAAAAIALQPNGKIVAAGLIAGSGGPDFALVRYTVDGSLDTSFGGGGEVVTGFGTASDDRAQAVAIQPDGKIVAAGFSDAGSSIDFALARYLGEPTAIAVSVDIKSGSSTNPISLSSRGLIPVAILTTDSFDATSVNPSTVCFGDDDNPSQRDCTEAHGTGHIEDVNGDGSPDLELHYEVSQTGIDPDDTMACLTGKTFAGVGIEGCDVITIV